MKLLTILTALLALTSMTTAQSAPPTGAALPQWLVDQAAPGSTVQLPSGTFAGLRITKPLHVRGDSRGVTVFTGRIVLVQGEQDASSLSWIVGLGGLIALKGNTLALQYCDIRGTTNQPGVATTVRSLTLFASSVEGGRATTLTPKAGIASTGRVSVLWGRVEGGLGMTAPRDYRWLASTNVPTDPEYQGGPGIVALAVGPLTESAWVRGGRGVQWDERGTRSPRGPSVVVQP
jgi:hypothetical protein